MDDDHARSVPVRVARHHQARAARQRLPDRLERLAPHQHRLAHRERLEAFEVIGQMPRHGIVAPDDAVARHRHDERQLHTSTAVVRMTSPRPGMRKNSADGALRLCMRANSRRCNPCQPGSGRARTTCCPTKNEQSSMNTFRPRARVERKASPTSGVSMNPKYAVMRYTCGRICSTLTRWDGS